MRKSQISVEFSILLAVAVFLMIFILGFVPVWLEGANSPMNEANNMARDVKERVIIASLSPVNFISNITIPDNIGYTPIRAELSSGDDVLYIMEAESERILARAFLPDIDSAEGEGNTIVISKVGNSLSVVQVTADEEE